MGMAISSSSTSSTQATSQGGAAAWQKRAQDFKALQTALKSNDLDGAKAAYADLTSSGAGKAASTGNGPLAQLGQALKNGDLSGAQKAFVAIRAHHRHQADGGSSAGGVSAPVATPSSPTAMIGNNLDVMA